MVYKLLEGSFLNNKHAFVFSLRSRLKYDRGDTEFRFQKHTRWNLSESISEFTTQTNIEEGDLKNDQAHLISSRFHCRGF